LRIYRKNLVGRMYEKSSTFLRVEVCVNRMKDLGLNKGLENLECLYQRLVAITDRFADFEAQSLNVPFDFSLFQRMALPVMAGKTKIAGIKIHDTRMMRLMEVLLHGTQLNGWSSPISTKPSSPPSAYRPAATTLPNSGAIIIAVLSVIICGVRGAEGGGPSGANYEKEAARQCSQVCGG
jgi:hypothetical protein